MAKIKKASLYKKVERVEVFIWGRFVGAVALDPKLGFYIFAYDKKFGESGIQLSPIHMPLTTSEAPFVFTDLPEATYKRLPAMLADALPDDFGNSLVDRYMAQKGISPSQVTTLDRLAYMGNRSMGALEFKPGRGPRTSKSVALEMSQLVTEARKMVKKSFGEDDETNAALRSIIEVGTSAGGVRAKAVIAWNPKTEQIRSGQVDVDDGFEHWLLKFDGMGTDKELGKSGGYGRIEYAYSLMARDAGIFMSECRLLEEGPRAHFMTKRFDREGASIKHHLQTLCALSHLDYKKKSTNSYEQLFLTVQKLQLPHSASVEVFRRMTFNIMARNCDDHTKNFSFRLKEGQSWELAPAYDVTFAHNPKGEWTHQHLMSANGKFKDFTRYDLLGLADRFGVGEAKVVIKEIESALKKWPTFAKEAGVSREDTARIKKRHLDIK